MRGDLVPVIEKLVHGIAALELMVRDLTFAAHEVAESSAAEVLRGLARRHRVKILEMNGQLAAVADQYVNEACREL